MTAGEGSTDVDAGSRGNGFSCTACLGAAHQRLDCRLERWGLNYRQRLLVFHFLDQLKEQILAVLPISLLLVFVIGAFFQQTTKNPGEQAYGLVCAIFGLLFFMDGLRVCVMPLGEMVGSRLPLKYPLYIVLLVAGCLGILVTYAEPAIASLSPLAKLVDKTRAPYLYYALNDQREMLVLSIGLGVGAAAVVGTLRFVKGWSLKPIIYVSLVPTIALACYMQWGNPDLAPLLGLAWDCGAVTTGPVTVPILLAMGIGVMSSQRQKRLAQAALHNAVDTNTGQTLEGFGVVTLASVFPVLAVEIMGIMISLTKTKEDIILTAKDTTSNSPAEQSPIREVVFAIRAIMPLIVALLLLVLLLIREPLPPLTVFTVPLEITCAADEAAFTADGKRNRRASTGSVSGAKDAAAGRTDSYSRGPSTLGSTSLALGGDSTALAGAGMPSLATSSNAADAKGASAGVGASGQLVAVKVGVQDVETPARRSSASGLEASSVRATAAGPVAEATEGDGNEQDVRPDMAALVSASQAQPEEPKAEQVQEKEAKEDGRPVKRPSRLSKPQRQKSLDRCPTPHPRKSGKTAKDAPEGDEEEEEEAPGLDQSEGGGEGRSGIGRGRLDKAGSVVMVVVEESPAAALSPGLLQQEPWYIRYGGLICGVIMAQGGMIMFNIGLTYGFTALGDQAGTLLPAAYLQVPEFPKSPYYSYGGGIVLVMVVAFVLGFLATRAEPALRVLGRTVQHLSGGAFTAAMLIYAVSVGVGSGMAVGSTKILFGVPLIYIILVKYAIAVSITIFSEESFTNIAWDSAGVTTGPVTVPFVLSLGIGFSKATKATEGFGILTAASVAPIISVLLTNLLKKPAKAALRQLSRLSFRSKSGGSLGPISRSSLAVLSRRAKRHKDTNQAISSVAAIAAAAARLEEQSTSGSLSMASMPSLGVPSSDPGLASPSVGGPSTSGSTVRR